MLVALVANLSQTIVPSVDIPASTGDPCALFDEASGSQEAGERKATARDLAELADIGRSDPSESESAFGISPDGRRIAFVVRRPNPEMNAFCQKLLVRAMDGSGPVVELDRGGTYIRDDFDLFGFTAITAGWAKVITPRWSPDGERLGFIKREGSGNQVWIVEADGRGSARQATMLPDNVDDFEWLENGTQLVVATRPGIRVATERIAREAADGYLFDERFWPQAASRPVPRTEFPTVHTTVDLASGDMRPSTEGEIARMERQRTRDMAYNGEIRVQGPDGEEAWIEQVNPEELLGGTQLVIKPPGGPARACAEQRCSGILRLWWSNEQQAFFAVQKTGWARSEMGILRWDIDAAAPRQLMRSDAMLIGCALAAGEIVCASESGLQPRQLVGIALATGKVRSIHDPNPGFGQLRLGTVERFRFRNAFGVESLADFVLPPDHRPGQIHPLVVVQYSSLGLLRGGTGDEVPIQALAARGYAVLSFERPSFVPQAREAKTEAELMAANRVDWADRRNVQASLDKALELAIATGTVDRSRMGISGWSDGASTVQWALNNSAHFKVATLAGCCEDIYAYPLASGPAYAQMVRKMGYKFFEPGTREYWRPMSMVLNVDRIDIPILIQSPDSEYEIGLDMMEVYREAGRPVEMFVFADETHYKWQAAHRLAIYQRNLEWFDFWLRKKVNCAADRDAQYARWKAMAGAPGEDELTCVISGSGMP